MTPKRRTKRKSHFKLQNDIDMQPPSISKNHTDHEQDSQNIEGTLNNQRDVVSNQLHVDVQGMAPKHRTKRKSCFKLQAEIDMQPPSIGTLNNQRDVVSNQLHVDVQGNVPLVENMSPVPDQNDDMIQEYNEDFRLLFGVAAMKLNSNFDRISELFMMGWSCIEIWVGTEFSISFISFTNA
ncbi:hypothetical protein ZIOFF_069918 [Zingiber officinale]|uniref:Uncharacterized protein n=1 Tax=Zingiber officinale TaxID=94328 RepID=A0A8J5CBW1_ZINOF|nr:hypothetical protein ZIOFF_069918 [Zingiber officinale]